MDATMGETISFNSSVGILSVGTVAKAMRHIDAQRSFNSSVGILSLGTRGRPPDRDHVGACFNSSVGILSVGTSWWRCS